MAFGWSQKFKCGGIESFNNIKAYVDKGALVDEAGGCLTQDPEVANGWALVLHVHYMCGIIQVFAPNLWHDDVMVVLGDQP